MYCRKQSQYKTFKMYMFLHKCVNFFGVGIKYYQDDL